jgi:hypothetical protein
MESSLRTLRIVRVFMLASVVMYAYIANRFGPVPRPNQPIVFYAISGLSVSIVVVVFAVRRVVILRQQAILAAQPEDRSALARWQRGYIMIYALCEAIALYGFVLRYIGFAFSQVVTFYLSGFFLMLFFSPKRQPSTMGTITP